MGDEAFDEFLVLRREILPLNHGKRLFELLPVVMEVGQQVTVGAESMSFLSGRLDKREAPWPGIKAIGIDALPFAETKLCDTRLT